MTIEQVRIIISEGKTNEAINELKKITKKLRDKDFYNGILLLSSEYKDLEKVRIPRVAHTEELKLALQKINFSLLEYCDQIEFITKREPSISERKIFTNLKLQFMSTFSKKEKKIETSQNDTKNKDNHSIEPNSYAFNSHLKDIYLEIPEYTYNHSSVSGDKDEIFIGRDKIKEKFLNILKFGKQNGAYLVTGYRGMGKTSFVKNVIAEYKRDLKDDLCKIDISFAQSELKEIDILRQLTQALINNAEKNLWIKIRKRFSIANLFRFVAFILSIVFIYKIVYPNIDFFSKIFSKEPNNEYKLNIDNAQSLFVALSLIVLSAVSITYALVSIKLLIEFLVKLLNKIRQKLSWSVLKKFKEKGFLAQSIKKVLKNKLNVIFLFVFFIFFALFLTQKYYSGYINYLIGGMSLFIFFIGKNYENYLSEYIMYETANYKRLNLIYERCNATITKESSVQNQTPNLPFGFIYKDVKVYPLASAKELEYELIEILKTYNKFKNYKKKFLIVFDELDKVEPAFGKGYYYDDTKSLSQYDYSQNQLNDIRDRKRVVINILASFKYFITEANARFIFIAGREMFDAALADIADRQSSISSIFHHIIYVDSFLKDTDIKNRKSGGLTDLVESYLHKVLIKEEDKTLDGLMKTYFSHLDKVNKIESYKEFSSLPIDKIAELPKLTKDEKMKIIFTLQNFIIYLTYRSNGSPKKLVRLIEDYIISQEQLPQGVNLNIITYDKDINTEGSDKRKKKEIKYLHFDSNAQYKFGFITYLYRPFLISYSQTIKKYSDNVLVSTPYLMDHLIKFHPYAFSLQNLELLPEVLSANRNPILRFFIEELIYFLSQNHVRETDIGLFEYKFFNKTSNEIIYLSKIFEEESAAFNFTLDESYFIKLYLRNKVKELRNSYKDFKKSGEYIYSISFLNGILGDAHYFDQEFDDAIVSYHDALQHLRTEKSLTYEQFVLWMKYKLKLGLIHEKMKSYDIALSYYNDAIIESKKYITNYGRKPISQNVEINEKVDIHVKLNHRDGEIDKDKFASLDEGLQIINQAYIASLYLYDKINIGGVNEFRVHRYQKEFLDTLKKVKETEAIYNNLVASNYYNNVGTLLYYKNMILEKDNKNDCAVKTSKIQQLICERFAEFGTDFTDTEEENGIKKPKFIEEPKNKDYRFSFFAFWHYKNALESVLAIDETKGKHFSLIKLCKECGIYLSKYENKFDKTRLRMIGFTLSKIGDILFSTLNTEKGRIGSDKVFFSASKAWLDKVEIDKNIEKLKNAKDNNENKALLKGICEGWMDSTIKEKEGKYVILGANNEDIELTVLNAYEYLKKHKGKYRLLSFIDKTMIQYFETYTEGPDCDIDFILYVYLIAGRYYSKAGKSISFSFQLRKIIHVIRNTVNIRPKLKDNIDEYFEKQSRLIQFLEKVVLAQILEITSWNTNSSDRPQIYKYKDSVGKETIFHPPHLTKYIYSHISNSPEVKEAVLFLADIKVKSTDFSKFEKLQDLDKCPEQGLINPSFSIGAQFTRIQELGLQEKINRSLLEEYLSPRLLKKEEGAQFAMQLPNSPLLKKDEVKFYDIWEKQYFKIFKKYDPVSVEKINGEIVSVDKREKISVEEIKTVEDFIDRLKEDKDVSKKVINEYILLVANSISSLTQIISIIRVYDVNYYMSYSFLAVFQMKLGTWLKHYALCKELARRMKKDKTEGVNDIDKDFLQPMMGTQAMITLDTTSQYQIALQYFHKAKQVHSNGATYQTQVRNMLYLEDDFNDSLYHFGIALERQQINSYKVRKKIKRLEEELEDSPLYDYDSFVNKSH